MWDDVLSKKPAETSRGAQLFGKSAMRRTAAIRQSAICLCLVLLARDAASQSYNTNNRAQTISNIFQIPIQTLTAISNFAQNTRPIGEIIQRIRYPQIQQIQQIQRPLPQQYRVPSQPIPINNLQRSRAAKIAGVYTAADGSGFRI